MSCLKAVRLALSVMLIISFTQNASAQLFPSAPGSPANSKPDNSTDKSSDKPEKPPRMFGDRPQLRTPMRSQSNNTDENNNGMGINAIRFEGVDDSKVNGVVCSLVDGLANDDLMFAAQNLASKMEKVDGCEGNAGPQELKSSLAALVQSGKNLNLMTKENDDLSKSPDALKNYEAEVSSAISSLDSVGKSISSAGFLGSRCGRNLLSGTDMLLSVSKMIQTVAPYALKAVQAHPAFAVGTRFIMGIDGAANFISVLKKMHDENTLDMSNEANQRAVRQNICEYGRIDYRVKAFVLAKDGALTKATEQISNQFNSYRVFLANKYLKNNGLGSFSAIRADKFNAINDIQKDLRKYLKIAKDNKKEIAALSTQINSGKNLSLSCNTTAELVSRAALKAELPGRVLETLNNVTKNQVSVTISQKSLIKTELDLRTEIAKSSATADRKQVNQCVELGKDYIDTLAQISDLTLETIKELRQQADELDSDILDINMDGQSVVDSALMAAPESVPTIIDAGINTTMRSFGTPMSTNAKGRSTPAPSTFEINPSEEATKSKKNYKSAVQAIKQEMDRLIAIVDSSQEPNVLKILGADNSAISMTAIGKFMDDSKQALFNNGKKGMSCKAAELASDMLDLRANICPESPTLAYLNYSQKQLAAKHASFDRQLVELRKDVFTIMMNSGQSKEKTLTYKSLVESNNIKENLSVINLTTIPKLVPSKEVGSKTMVKNPYHENICRRLIDIRQQWYFVMSAYAEQQQVCSYIYNLQDEGFEPRLRQYCGYRKDLPGVDNRVSTLRKNYDQLQKISATDALLIQNKSKELGCSEYYGIFLNEETPN